MPLTALAARDDPSAVALGARHLLRHLDRVKAHDALEPETQDDAFALTEFTSHRRTP